MTRLRWWMRERIMSTQNFILKLLSALKIYCVMFVPWSILEWPLSKMFFIFEFTYVDRVDICECTWMIFVYVQYPFHTRVRRSAVIWNTVQPSNLYVAVNTSTLERSRDGISKIQHQGKKYTKIRRKITISRHGKRFPWDCVISRFLADIWERHLARHRLPLQVHIQADTRGLPDRRGQIDGLSYSTKSPQIHIQCTWPILQ